MIFYVYKCKQCDKVFCCNEDAKNCPYCKSSRIEFIPRTTAKIIDETYIRHIVPRHTFEDNISTLLEVLSPYSKLTHKNALLHNRLSSSDYRKYVSKISNLIEHIGNTKTDITFTNDFINSKYINYYEFKVITKDNAFCIGTINKRWKCIDSYRRMLKDIEYVTNQYAEHGYKYYFIPTSDINKIDFLLTEAAKKLVGRDNR